MDDVIYGCANQAGEDNRNVARMAALLAGLPVDVPGVNSYFARRVGINAPYALVLDDKVGAEVFTLT